MPSARCSIDSIGHWLIQLYGLGDKVEAFRESYARWGAVIILLKGLTPIPYKLVTITSGFAGYNIVLFILCSIVARGGRFFIAAIAAEPLWRLDQGQGRAASRAVCRDPLPAVLVLGFIVAFKHDLSGVLCAASVSSATLDGMMVRPCHSVRPLATTLVALPMLLLIAM